MRAAIVILALALCGTAAAENPGERLEALQAAQADAEASARRRGDDALTCDQLQAEMMTISQSPEMATFQADNSAFAAQAQQQMQAARGQMAGAMGMSVGMMGLGVASAFVPGLGMAQSLAMRGYAANAQRQAAANQGMMGQQADAMAAAMPMLTRMQRVAELGQAKQCAFVQGPPGQQSADQQ